MCYQHKPQGFSPIWLLWCFPTTGSHKEPHNSLPSTARPSHFPNSQHSQIQAPKSHPHRVLPPAAPHTGAHRKQGEEDEPPKARPTEAGAAPTGADAWVEVVESCPISLETSLLPSALLTSFAELPAGLGRPRSRAPRVSGGLQMELEGGKSRARRHVHTPSFGGCIPQPTSLLRKENRGQELLLGAPMEQGAGPGGEKRGGAGQGLEPREVSPSPPRQPVQGSSSHASQTSPS